MVTGLLLAALICPGVAVGSDAGIVNGTLIYNGAPGEGNGLAIFESGPGAYDLSDDGVASINPGPNCMVAGPGVTCTGSVTAISVDVGDMPDVVNLFLTTPLPADILGRGGDDRLSGQIGEDTIDGGEGGDSIFGLGGNDSLEGGVGDDRLRGDEPFEFTPPDLIGEAGDDVVNGGEGNDQLDGGNGSDSVTGGAGDDFYAAATARPDFCPPDNPPCPAPPTNGVDTFSGGPGRDLVDYTLADAPLFVSLDSVQNDGEGGEQDNIHADVEDVVGGPAGDTLVGSEGGTLLDGGGGNEPRVEGLGGDDELRGGEGDVGSDILDGGEGVDIVDSGPGDDRAIGGGGNDRLDGDSGQDNLQGDGGEDLVQGGPGSDPSVAGGDGNDRVFGANDGAAVGGDGADLLTGDAGDDTLSGGPANDSLEGAAGSDSLAGGEGEDIALFRGEARVVVTLDGASNDGPRGERDDVARDVEDVEAGGGSDDLFGNEDANVLRSGEDEDYVDGGRQADTLLGGAAGDVIRSSDGNVDTVDCGTGRGADFAIADSRDRVSRCETVEIGARTPPVLGRKVVVAAERGDPEFGPTGIRRTVPLEGRLRIPVGSQVDATKASVRLSAAASRRRTQSGTFSGARFRVLQRRTRRPVTELRLKGGNFRRCRRTILRGGTVAVGVSRRAIRRLGGRARGHFRARGRNSAATVRGTVFSVTDRCDGTLTRVRRGVVRVRDFRRRRTIVLRAGGRYLARARGY
jgi:Ca2+-binding RTX toxin-like protein